MKNFFIAIIPARSGSKELKNNDIIIPLAALVGAPLCAKYKKEAVSTNFNAIKIILECLKRRNKLL